MTAQPNPRPLFSENRETSSLSYYGAPTRPLYWSVRRELWENRSIYIAPLIVSGLVLFGFAISAVSMPHRRRNLLAIADPERQRALVEQPYDIVAMMILFTAFLVGVFYCLDALHGERRDRSILFWKSLPVSDFTSVLAKALIPLAVLPLLTCAIIVITQLIMVVMTTVALLPAGLGATTFTRLPFGQMSVILVYGVVAMTLWHAPIYAWLLLVSAWARRATFLWAVLPWIAVCIVEKIAFNTAHFAALLGRRFGGTEAAFRIAKQGHETVIPAVDRFSQLNPIGFLTSPGLWIGLVIAAAFFYAAVRLRRDRGPL
jgi:ABC-2 type transport system permease protein